MLAWMETIMSKIEDASQVRELRDDELEQVTGGLVVPAIIQPLIALDISRPPANAAAMAAWNDLLRQNGF
jgi:hypothetical protein